MGTQAQRNGGGIGGGEARESVIAVRAGAAEGSILQVESHPGVSVRPDGATEGRDISRRLLHTVDVGRDDVAFDTGTDRVTVRDRELCASGVEQEVEVSDGTVPP